MEVATNCVFSGNQAGLDGGGMCNWQNADATVTNCTFSENEALNQDGGGVANVDGSNLTATNCVFWGNADSGGMDESAQVHNDASTAVVDYCWVQGWTGALGGVGNIGEDPLFVDAYGADAMAGTEDDDLHLRSGSPCIDAGDAGGDYAGQVDMDGQPRVIYGHVDMGADEFAWSGDLDLDEDVDTDDFMTFSFCHNRSLNPPQSGCTAPWSDIDMDGDVDGFDFLTFSLCYNGAGRPAGCE
jgi:hypothetical protein